MSYIYIYIYIYIYDISNLRVNWQFIIDVSEERTASVLKIRYSVVLCILYVCVCVCVCVYTVLVIEARGGSGGWGTVLQAGGRVFDSRWGPSGRTMALELTQPLKKWVSGVCNGGWGKDCRCVGLTTQPPTCAVGYSPILACVGGSLQITSPFSCTDSVDYVM